MLLVSSCRMLSCPEIGKGRCFRTTSKVGSGGFTIGSFLVGFAAKFLLICMFVLRVFLLLLMVQGGLGDFLRIWLMVA
jgi:hypothetical protein